MRSIAASLLLTLLLSAESRLGAAELSLSSRAVSIPEAGFFTNLVLRAARHEFSFMPPQLWKLSIDTNSSTLTWQSSDRRSLFRLRLLPATVGAGDPSVLEQRLRKEFAAARVQESFPVSCVSHSGIAFELEQRLGAGLPFTSRVAFLDYGAGLVELEVTCPTDEFSETQHRFGWVLNSLNILPRRGG